MKIQIDYAAYDRFEDDFTLITIEGKTLRSCLLEAFDQLNLYETPEDIISYEVNENNGRLSDTELLNRMLEQSGDGSDLIIAIKNLDTGEFLYTNGYSNEPESPYRSKYDDEPSFEEEVEEYTNEE